MIPGCTGNARLEVPADVAAGLCERLDGLDWRGAAGKLFARPLEEAEAKLAVHGRIREALRTLRGPETGLQSFHNFVPGTAAGSAQAMRSLKHCSVSLRSDVRAGNHGLGWRETDFAVVILAAKSFAPQQLRHLLGALVAVVRGCEDLEYLKRCFQEEPLPVPQAPAEALSLHAVTLHGCDGKWRKAVQLDAASLARVCREIEARVLLESREPWAAFVRSLDAGATRAHLAQELALAAAAGDAVRLELALASGAHISAADEYGRSALFMAAQEGQLVTLAALLARRADALLPANGGCTPLAAAVARGHEAAATLLLEAGASPPPACPGPGVKLGAQSAASVDVIIPATADHAGAGTVVIDGAFGEEFLDCLASLWSRLALAPKDKASPTERGYYSDAEGRVTRALDSAAALAPPPANGRALPQMRFLRYAEPGGALPAHVDLPRIGPAGVRTTCSFLLYLTDCPQGGETLLLQGLPGDAALAASGGVAPGGRETLARVAPRRGRLLLMPHACPHAAAPTVDVPKVLVRGELLPPEA